MKRFLPTLPLFLFLLLNACNGNPGAIPPAQGTAVAQTQTATVWTPTVTPPPDPDEKKIVGWLNDQLSSDDDGLGKMIDADYQVQDVFFAPAPNNNSALVFRVDIRCQCSNHTQCCVPERMFVAAMQAMKKRADKILKEVPNNVSEVKVVCFHDGLRMNVIAALWPDAKAYLSDKINGFQFGSRVYNSSVP